MRRSTVSLFRYIIVSLPRDFVVSLLCHGLMAGGQCKESVREVNEGGDFR